MTPTLRPYQREDLNVILGRFRKGDTAAICEWEPGLGKSLLSLAAWSEMLTERMLIVCPSVALVSWKIEIEKWAPNAPVLLLNAGKAISKLRDHHKIVVVSFDIAKNRQVLDTLRDWIADGFAVVDEAQYLRGPDTQRTAVCYGKGRGLLTNARRVLLLSGTLIVSWPTDLWTHLARWMPERITVDGIRLDFEGFRSRYLITQEVPIPGAFRKTRTQIRGMRPDMEADLLARTAGMSVRRTKDDAGLPPLTWLDVSLELTPKDRKAIDDALTDNLPPNLRALANRAQRSDEDAMRFVEALGEYTELMAVAMRILGVGKAKAVCRLLRERLENAPDSKGIGVFAVNHAVLDVIQSELADFGVVRVDGSTPYARRGAAVDAFQDPRGPRLFAGQISACGTALTLTRGDECWFPQLSWTPGDNEQAASRFHRIGQLNPVIAYRPFVPQTLDAPLMAVLRKKQKSAALLRQQEKAQ